MKVLSVTSRGFGLLLFAFLLMAMAIPASAWHTQVMRERLRSVRVQAADQWDGLPLIRLGQKGGVRIMFDDLTHAYCRYRYRIEHCNHDWTPTSGLFPSDCLKGDAYDQPIDDYKESLNTTMLYTHYSFDFPNDRVAPALSGNYRITVFDEDEDEDVLSVCLLVVDEKMTIQPEVTTQTDIDWNKKHQQVRLKLQVPASERVVDANRELKLVVMQNLRWQGAAVAPKPDFVTGSEVEWRYSKELIFPAGAEFRKFEMTNLHVGSMGIDNIRFFDPYYHVTLYHHRANASYLYDEDQNGAYVVRTDEYPDIETQSDYAYVHFTLQHQRLENGDVYVAGAATNGQFGPENRMVYNEDLSAYECVLLLKQGYYNFQYLFLPDKTDVALTAPIEGDFYQTENRYTVLLYHRPRGSRYDRLVAVRDFRFHPDKM